MPLIGEATPNLYYAPTLPRRASLAFSAAGDSPGSRNSSVMPSAGIRCVGLHLADPGTNPLSVSMAHTVPGLMTTRSLTESLLATIGNTPLVPLD
ncbi:MAG: hypothetical protein JO099_19125 [Acidobacteriia bacterium]|nr:hypothetical protein [Terriglobia bacterium]